MLLYLINNNSIEHFITSVPDDTFVISNQNYTEIKENAFANSEEKNIVFKSSITKIMQNAFENCKNLENVIFFCGHKNNDGNYCKSNKRLDRIIVENQKLSDIIKQQDLCDGSIYKKNDLNKVNLYLCNPSRYFTVQKEAFKNCTNLKTVIFPCANKITIEKDAFWGCESLRTIIAITKVIDFTNNPFESCIENLVFICRKNSNVDKFAREYGYKTAYV